MCCQSLERAYEATFRVRSAICRLDVNAGLEIPLVFNLSKLRNCILHLWGRSGTPRGVCTAWLRVPCVGAQAHALDRREVVRLISVWGWRFVVLRCRCRVLVLSSRRASRARCSTLIVEGWLGSRSGTAWDYIHRRVSLRSHRWSILRSVQRRRSRVLCRSRGIFGPIVRICVVHLYIRSAVLLVGARCGCWSRVNRCCGSNVRRLLITHLRIGLLYLGSTVAPVLPGRWLLAHTKLRRVIHANSERSELVDRSRHKPRFDVILPCSCGCGVCEGVPRSCTLLFLPCHRSENKATQQSQLSPVCAGLLDSCVILMPGSRG